MAKQMSEDEIYGQARKKVEEKKRFYSGLATYALVNAVLVVTSTETTCHFVQ